jgi:uncharacterized protein with LGFP repeats
MEDIRTAALLFNMKDLGISNDVLCKAAQVSEEDLQQGRNRKAISKGAAMGGFSTASDPDSSVRAAIAAGWRETGKCVSASANPLDGGRTMKL